MKTNNKPSAESKLFIEWAINELKNDEFMSDVISRIKQQQEIFYQSDKEVLLARLRNKMVKGSIEHGDPLKDFKQIEKELQDEYLDLIGYTLIYAWALRNYVTEASNK